MKRKNNVWYKNGNVADTAVWTLIICLKNVKNESTMRTAMIKQSTAF